MSTAQPSPTVTLEDALKGIPPEFRKRLLKAYSGLKDAAASRTFDACGLRAGRFVARQGAKGATVDLEWAVDTGPIKLVLYRDGHSDGQVFFEHSVAGMQQAFAFAKQYAGEER